MEVNLHLKLPILATIFLFSITAHSKLLNIGFNQNDKKAALHLIQLLRNHELKGRDHRELSKAISYTKNKKNAFAKYHDRLVYLEKISKNRKQQCQKASISSLYDDLITKRIERIIAYECNKRSLSQFMAKKKFNKEDVQNVLPIVFKSNNKLVWHSQKIIKQIANSNHAEILETYIIQNELKDFHSSLLKYFPDTSLLSSYLQTVGFHDRQKKNSYYRTLNINYRKFKRAMRKDRFKKAKSIAKDSINFFMVNAENFDKSKAWNIFRLMGRSLVRQGFYDEGLEQFKLATLISDKSLYSESVFNILWVYLIQDKYDKAQKFIYNERLENKITSLDEKLQFWIAKIYLKNGFKIRAKQFLKNLIDQKALNYYTILAKKELTELDKAEGQRILASLYQTTPNSLKEVLFTESDTQALRRYKVFHAIKASSYSYNQLLSITRKVDLEASPKDLKKPANYYFSIIKFLHKENDHLTSFKILYSALNKEYFNLDENLLALLFPNNYMSTIAKHTKDTNPILFLSLIRQESAFNPSAKSRVGARGLMQIMPSTARQYYRRLRASSLNQPSLNLKIGIKYFQMLAKKYEGNLIYTLAAYNAGEGRVKRWKRDIFKSEDPLVNIESIPFDETQNYVKLIYRNIFYYQYLNNSEKTLGDIDDSFKIGFYSPKKP